MSEPIDFAERRRQLAEERAAAGITSAMAPPPPVVQPGPPPAPEGYVWNGDDLGNEERSDDDQLDGIINQITVADAYNKFIRKMHAVANKKDGNVIACPLSDHADPAPNYNAWFSTDGTWFCGKCQEGGDTYDLAAIGLGFNRPGYKDGAEFHRLREQMAESFGWRIKRVPGGEIVYKDQPAPPPPSAPHQPDTSGYETAPLGAPPATVTPEVLAAADPEVYAKDDNVVHMFGADPEAIEFTAYPSIDWRKLVPPDTFLHAYLSACSNDDSPEEYHFWNGLMALGSACGRKVVLEDEPSVKANLFVCILGDTGTGKSRSLRWLAEVVRECMPYQEDGSTTTGTRMIPVPSSGEYLVKQFMYETKDPANSKRVLGFSPVNGLVNFDELSALLARSGRQGSSMIPTLQAFADCAETVDIGGLMRGDFSAPQPFCSVTASTQPRAIRDLLNRADANSGFLNRWVFIGGVPKETEVLGGSRSSRVIDLTASKTLLKEVHGWAGFERVVKFEDDAFELYTSYMKKIIFPTKKADDTDLLKRIDLLVKKILLLFTINRKRVLVDADTVRACVPIIEFVVRCFRILDSSIGRTQMDDAYDDILNQIRRARAKNNRPPSARDIWQNVRRRYSLLQIKQALEIMSALDLIELAPKDIGQAGRPTARYQIVGEV